MNRAEFSDEKIIDSWSKNASAWSRAVRSGAIESRRLVTDRAIVDTLLGLAPHTVLDIGCGEGWLARRLAAEGIEVTGVDGVAELVDAARRAGGGEFHLLSYEALAAGGLCLAVDAAVCNFSLLGEAAAEGVVRAVPRLLHPGGRLIVQTLHPLNAGDGFPYRDGWRAGSWAGFGPEFTDPAPWYFRTLESWKRLFEESGFERIELREPLHPTTGKPLSVIFIAGVG